MVLAVIKNRKIRKRLQVCSIVYSWTSGLPGHLASGWFFFQICQFKRWQKMIVMSSEHLKKISNFPKLQGCGFKNGPAIPTSNLKLISS